jgi:hypothetical protein
VVAKLQISGGEVNVEHSARAILDVNTRPAPPTFLMLKTLAHAPRLKAQGVRARLLRRFVNDPARFPFDPGT